MSTLSELEEHFLYSSKWLHNKLNIHLSAKRSKIMAVCQGSVWRCNLGYNIGEEKNKERPVVVISNNSINRTGKIVVVSITDARGPGKINKENKPQHNTWMLLYSNTPDPALMYTRNRSIPKDDTPYEFLMKDSIIQCEDIRSVSKARLIKPSLGRLTPRDWEILERKISNLYK